MTIADILCTVELEGGPMDGAVYRLDTIRDYFVTQVFETPLVYTAACPGGEVLPITVRLFRYVESGRVSGQGCRIFVPER